MKKFLFQTKINASVIQLALLLIRLSSGGFMLTHGYPKLERLLDGNFRFGDPLGLGPEVSLFLTVFAEVLCAVLIMLGLGTRLAVIPLIIAMSVAAFVSHGADPFARKELALFYLVSYVILLLTGSGKISVDYLLGRKKTSRK